MAKKILFGVIMLTGTVLFCEIVLQMAAFFLSMRHQAASGQPIALQVDDPLVGVRGNPSYPGHDARGFRNPSVPQRAHLIALGDSQTYGVGVLPDQAWPSRLAAANISTYSMAFGSYGPAHSLLLLEEALSFRPAVVVEVFYSGNDLYDSFVLVHKRRQLPELRNASHDLSSRIAVAEKTAPLDENIQRLSRAALMWNERPPAPAQTTLDKLAEHYELVRLGRKLFNLLGFGADTSDRDPSESDQRYWDFVREESIKAGEHRLILENGSIRTVLTPRYRLSGVDLRDPRIEEGLQIALSAIQRMAIRLNEEGTRFIVLLMPTKELVFMPLVPPESPQGSDAYRALVENEERIWHKTKSKLKQLRIEYLDALPILRGLVQGGIQPYPVSWDGHPNAAGHRALADLVRTAIARQR